MIHHIAIGTTHPSHLAAFYLKIPGSKLIKEHFYESGSIRSVWIQFGSILLMLEDGKRESPKNLVFALGISKEAEWREFLASITIVSRTDFTMYFQDPDGNGLGVSTYPEKFPTSLEMS
ncbi:VOC family protein [Leptospira levettii]|uniref:VOC family protein n=1 Tax=Leptospira levettii TaxID=2023178 RepID=UPI001082B79E|nr:VOC family protein [Leptospira levettii]MCW7509446.1 VOC family protein [Leptospira levettii]MCW7520730.1 VOC family protein [Leptospira levettii]TGL02103.1 VOC family protein [Leptospira levettii]